MFRFSLPRAILATILAINLGVALLGAPTVLQLAAHAAPTSLADGGGPIPPTGH
jgi:hypothetical protein